jgi:dTMP kinase
MSQPGNEPLFVVFEGLDGAGKTTCARALAKAIGAQYMTTPPPEVRAVLTKVLDSLGDSQEARQLFYLATVFAAANQVRAALAAGTSVVMDRYFLSTQIYAEMRGSRLDLDGLGEQLLAADLTVYLDVPMPVRRARLFARHCTPADRETLTPDINAGLRSRYLQKSALAVAGKFVRLANAAGSADELVERVIREIAKSRSPAPGCAGANREAAP